VRRSGGEKKGKRRIGQESRNVQRRRSRTDKLISLTKHTRRELNRLSSSLYRSSEKNDNLDQWGSRGRINRCHWGAPLPPLDRKDLHVGTTLELTYQSGKKQFMAHRPQDTERNQPLINEVLTGRARADVDQNAGRGQERRRS